MAALVSATIHRVHAFRHTGSRLNTAKESTKIIALRLQYTAAGAFGPPAFPAKLFDSAAQVVHIRFNGDTEHNDQRDVKGRSFQGCEGGDDKKRI